MHDPDKEAGWALLVLALLPMLMPLLAMVVTWLFSL